MFKHYFENIPGVSIYPIISLGIFFTFFVGLIIWVIKADNKYMNKVKNMPLEEGNEKQDETK